MNAKPYEDGDPRDYESPGFGTPAINTGAVNAISLAAQRRGAFGHALHASLDARPEDERIETHRLSAFMPEGSDLARRLRACGCDTVVIAGAATNVRCESSARDAAQMNFRTIMASDAAATIDRAAHIGALATFYSMFGDVMRADMIVAALGPAAGAPGETGAGGAGGAASGASRSRL